jgi:hypothetical protein
VLPQELRKLERFSFEARWPSPLRCALLHAAYEGSNFHQLSELPAIVGNMMPSEQALLAARLGPARLLDPWRGGGVHVSLRLWDDMEHAFAMRIFKLEGKLRAVRFSAERKVSALRVNGEMLPAAGAAWPRGLTMLDALRYLDWAAYLKATSSVNAADSAPSKDGSSRERKASKSARQLDRERLQHIEVDVVMRARQAAKTMQTPRNVIYLQLDSFTEDEVRSSRRWWGDCMLRHRQLAGRRPRCSTPCACVVTAGERVCVHT